MPTTIRYHRLIPLDTEPVSSFQGWARFVFVMLLGSAFGKTFYYLGIPPAKIFIGDVVLGMFFLLRPRELCDRWIGYLIEKSVISPFAWVLLLSVLYGVFEVYYGLSAGYPTLTALENLVFNLYPIYFFLGMWVGAEHPTMLQKVIRAWAWTLAIYGPAYMLFLSTIPVFMPGTKDVPVFSQAGGGGFLILSLLARERKPLRFWFPMLISAIMVLAIQVRAEWVSVIVGFSVWGLLERKLTKCLSAFALAGVLLLVGFVADVDLPGTAGRGGRISSTEIVARGLSAISPQLGQEFTDSKSVYSYAGTIIWRTKWWNAIWSSVAENDSLTKRLIGNGYGYPLKELVTYLKGQDIRTPHSIFYFALGYSGWIGVALFFSLQASLVAMSWRAYKLTGESYGIVFVACTLIPAFFGNSFETPSAAIPFYLCMGLFLGPSLCRKPVIVPAESLRRTGGGEITLAPAASYPQLSAG